MILNKQQLSEIKSFIEKHGYCQPDVQMEMLDHIASSVEEMMTADPSICFDDALRITYQSFGVMGLSTIGDGICNFIRNKYNKRFIKYFLISVGPRYFLLTCLAGWGIYKLHQYISRDNLYTFFICGIIIECGILLYSGIQSKHYKKYLTFQAGTTYLNLLGAVLLFTNVAILKIPAQITFFDLNVAYLGSTASVMLFINYFYAAYSTAKDSMKETVKLIDKYRNIVS